MKEKFEYERALPIATNLLEILRPFCEKVAIAGSIRRMQPKVGDVELLYIPKWEEKISNGELIPKKINKSQEKIEELINSNVLSLRRKSNGTTAFGKKVKLLVDNQSQIPIDLFACEKNQWINNLVSRTGGKMTNITIASHAKRMGWNWLMCDAGFVNKQTHEAFIPEKEEDVFGFVRIPYMTPEERP